MEEVPEKLTFRQWLKSNLINILLVVAVILGYILAVLVFLYSDRDYKARTSMSTRFPGELLLNGMECMALPLAVAALVLAVTSINMEDYSSVLLHMSIFVFLLKFEAVVLGVVFGVWIVNKNIDEDVYVKEGDIDKVQKNITSTDNYIDVVRSIFPPNVITMTLMRYKTVLIPNNETQDMYDWNVSRLGTFEGGTNVYGLLCYCIFFSIALSTLVERGDALKHIFETLYQMTLMITKWLLCISPALSICAVGGDAVEAWYSDYLVTATLLLIVAIVCAHVVQCFIVYPLIYFTLVWENPYEPIKYYFTPIIFAFITKSSWATFPVFIRDLELKGKMPSNLIKFALPIAQAVNKDGSAIYFAATLVFIYRTSDTDIDILELIKICCLGGVTSYMGSDIPYTNFLCILMIVEGLNLPIVNVPLLMAVEWIAGRTANLVNLVGNLYLMRILAVYNTKRFYTE